MIQFRGRSSYLDELVSAAGEFGWAAGRCPADQLVTQASQARYTIVPGRSVTHGFEELRPVPPQEASTRSLSAVYGLGQQPLHTDGAHLSNPPDIIVLAAAEPTTVATLLFRHVDLDGGGSGLQEDLRHGLFLVDGGKNTFLAPARTGWGRATSRIRFDPGCMTASDSRARRVVTHFAECANSATVHQWDAPDGVLIIDNRQVLHARADATADVNRTVQRMMLRLPREASDERTIRL